MDVRGIGRANEVLWNQGLDTRKNKGSYLKWWMIAQNASPSLKDVVRSVMLTLSYSAVTLEHQIWRARIPLRWIGILIALLRLSGNKTNEVCLVGCFRPSFFFADLQFGG